MTFRQKNGAQVAHRDVYVLTLCASLSRGPPNIYGLWGLVLSLFFHLAAPEKQSLQW